MYCIYNMYVIHNNDIIHRYDYLQIYKQYKPLFIVNYFDNYRNYLKNNTFNSVIKGVIKHNF